MVFVGVALNAARTRFQEIQHVITDTIGPVLLENLLEVISHFGVGRVEGIDLRSFLGWYQPCVTMGPNW